MTEIKINLDDINTNQLAQIAAILGITTGDGQTVLDTMVQKGMTRLGAGKIINRYADPSIADRVMIHIGPLIQEVTYDYGNVLSNICELFGIESSSMQLSGFRYDAPDDDICSEIFDPSRVFLLYTVEFDDGSELVFECYVHELQLQLNKIKWPEAVGLQTSGFGNQCLYGTLATRLRTDTLFALHNMIYAGALAAGEITVDGSMGDELNTTLTLIIEELETRGYDHEDFEERLDALKTPSTEEPSLAEDED